MRQWLDTLPAGAVLGSHHRYEKSARIEATEFTRQHCPNLPPGLSMPKIWGSLRRCGCVFGTVALDGILKFCVRKLAEGEQPKISAARMAKRLKQTAEVLQRRANRRHARKLSKELGINILAKKKAGNVPAYDPELPELIGAELTLADIL